MTELEIDYALFRHPDRAAAAGHQFVYLRDAPSAVAGAAESREATDKLAALKERLLTANVAPVARYRSADDLCDRFTADLTAAIERDADAQSHLREPLAEELDAQYVFANERVRTFVINDGDFEALDVFTDEADDARESGGEHVLFVSGERGCGKSALLANWVLRWRQQYDDPSLLPASRTLLFEHFLGCSAAGSGLACVVALLARCVANALGVDAKVLRPPKQHSRMDALADEDGDENELNAAAQVGVGRAADDVKSGSGSGGSGDSVDDEVSAKSSERDDADAFVEWVHIASQHFARVILVLDGVDLLHGVKQRGAAASLVFLQTRFPTNVRVMLSATPLSAAREQPGGGTVCDLLSRRATQTLRAAGFAMAGGLSIDSAAEPASAKAMLCAARLLCASAGKRLPTACERLLAASAAACASPRYLRLLLDELLATGRFESLDQQLTQLLRDGAGGVRDLCAVLVRRWEQTLSEQLVRDFICFLWMARDGLSEAELKELLHVRSDLQWVQLLATLGDIVMNHFGLLTFRHQDLKKVVKLRYLSDDSARLGYDRRLSEFFLAQPTTARTVREAAHHVLYCADACAGSNAVGAQSSWINGALRSIATSVERVSLLHRVAPSVLVALWRRCESLCEGGVDDVLAALLRSLDAVAASGAALSRVSSLQRTVAALMFDVGQFRAAEQLLHSALATDRHLYANAHLVIVRSLCSLALVVEQRGDIAGALKHAQAALDLCERLGGHQRVVSEPRVLQVCAHLEKRLGNYERAKERYALALGKLADQARDSGLAAPDHSASVTLELADVERKLGNIDVAEQLYKQVLAALEATCGAESYRLAPVHRCLGLVAKKRGVYDDALKHHTLALELHSAHFGADHPSCAEFLKDSADVLRKVGQYKQALAMYGQAMQLLRHTHGLPPCSCADATGACTCAFSHSDDGALELAELEHMSALVFKKLAQYARTTAMLTHALDVYRHILTPTHAKVGVLARDLADTLRKQDLYAEARKRYGEALKCVELTLGKRHEEAAEIHNSIGLIDKKQARYSDAERRFRTAIAIVKAVYGEEHAKVGMFLANIADVQRKSGDAQRAIQSLRDALRMTEASLGAAHIDCIEMRVRLARAVAAGSLAAAEREGALQTVRQCVTDIGAQLTPTHPKVGETVAVYAQMLLETGRAAEAAKEAATASGILRQALGPLSVELGDALTTAAEAAAALKRSDEAARLCEEARRIFEKAFASGDAATPTPGTSGNTTHPKLAALAKLSEELRGK
jgi:tetratricopeptide (TPR) repeat protein